MAIWWQAVPGGGVGEVGEGDRDQGDTSAHIGKRQLSDLGGHTLKWIESRHIPQRGLESLGLLDYDASFWWA